jgi:hypothetical protein
MHEGGTLSNSACGAQVRTSPYDPRFPSTNQARNCYTRYNEFYRWPPFLAVPPTSRPLSESMGGCLKQGVP